MCITIIGVLQWGGKLMFRGKAVGEVHHRKASLGKTHAVELIPLLVSIDPSAAVDADDHGQAFPICDLRTVHVQDLPLRVRPIDDIVIADNIRRCGQFRVPLVVALLEHHWLIGSR